jgi:RimJ/RimL family protein N-acetyltransferase
MELSFAALDLPREQDLLLEWLCSETWPFHVNAQLSQDIVASWIQTGIFTGTNHQTFWIVAASGEHIGLIRLYDLDDVDDGSPLFDLRIRSAYRRQGVGQRAVRWLTRYLFETYPQLDRIASTTRSDNYAMRQVFRRCGYVKEGHFRQDWDGSDGKKYDTIHYAILREDWSNQTTTPVNWDDEGDRTWKIRPYRSTDEAQWLRCRVLAFLDTAYFDNVLREKEHYINPAIELVAEVNQQIVGLIDVECEQEPGSVCSPSSVAGKAGMIWNLAVHPDFRRQGVGKALLQAAISIAPKFQLQRFEAWTRDDASTMQWYEAQGFQKVDTYLHVYLQDSQEVSTCVKSCISELRPLHVFAQYRGNDLEQIKLRFRRVHECNRYDLCLN